MAKKILTVAPAPAPAPAPVAPAPKAPRFVITDSDGNTIAVGVIDAKEFKTKSKGFFAQAKIEYNGKRYQTQVQLVEIGSKPNATLTK